MLILQTSGLSAQDLITRPLIATALASIRIHWRFLYRASPHLPRGAAENRLNSRDKPLYYLLRYVCIYFTRRTHNTMSCHLSQMAPLFNLHAEAPPLPSDISQQTLHHQHT